ncbi:TPA: hypothetical protein DF272_06190 [Candidatus Falkowbacteria bacterium]|nr:hypothetical protein [Candidatus Falkowbacteria bacterium]
MKLRDFDSYKLSTVFDSAGYGSHGALIRLRINFGRRHIADLEWLKDVYQVYFVYLKAFLRQQEDKWNVFTGFFTAFELACIDELYPLDDKHKSVSGVPEILKTAQIGPQVAFRRMKINYRRQMVAAMDWMKDLFPDEYENSVLELESSEQMWVRLTESLSVEVLRAVDDLYPLVHPEPMTKDKARQMIIDQNLLEIN